MKAVKPYTTERVVEDFLDIQAHKNYTAWNTALTHYAGKSLQQAQLRNTNNILIIGEYHNTPTPIIEQLTKGALSPPIIAAQIEHFHWCEVNDIIPEYIFVTHSKQQLNTISDEQLKRSILFYPITLPPHKRNIKTVYYYSVPYCRLENLDQINLSTIPWVSACLNPLMTMILLLIKYNYQHLHFIRPLSVNYNHSQKTPLYVKGLRENGWINAGAVVSNTMFQEWMRTKGKYPKVNITLHRPKGNIFGYKIAGVKKKW